MTTTRAIRVPGLLAQASVATDRSGIPHIRAAGQRT